METTLTDRVLGGRYEVGPLLGRGGMADVYDAVDTRLGRPVAVKVLRAAMATRPEVRRRFEDEARAAAKLSHPNVVAVYDTGEDEGLAWIVMERLSGETLAARMVPGRPLETEFVLRVAGDVLGALTAAHAAGIVHRDVKPGNILFADNGCAKVTDFGIAKSVEGVGDSTTAGMLLGTPRYLSPERVEGAASTASSDIYSLGVVLYEALTGQRAFEGDTPVTVAYRVQHTTPTPLAELRPDLPPALVALVEKAMTRDPAERFATTREMAAALAELQDSGLVDGVGAGYDAAEVDADATVAVARTAWEAGSPDPTSIAAAAPAAPAASRPGRRRGLDPRLIVVLAVGAVILLLLAVMAVGRDGNGTVTPAGTAGNPGVPQTPVGAELRAAAERLSTGDGDRGVEAARRLGQIADKVDAGQSAGADATSLLRDAAQWRSDGELGVRAFETLRTALAKVPGVDMNAAAVEPTASGDGDGDGEEKGDGKAKGKKDD